jgi:hypothetical protein
VAPADPPTDPADARTDQRPPRTPPATAPSLTLGQRLLVALPRLGRQHAEPVAAPAARPATSPATRQDRDARPSTTSTRASGTKATPAPAQGAASARTAAPAARPTTSPAKRPASKTGADPSSASSSASTAAPAKGTTTAKNTATAKDTSPVRSAGDPASPPTPAPTLGARFKDAMLKPKPEPPRAPGAKAPTKDDPYPEKSSAELRQWIKTLDDQERLFTLLAAPLAAALTIVSMVVGLEHSRTTTTTTHTAHAAHAATTTTSPETVVILGVVSLVFAIAVLVSGLLRRRSFAIFSLLFVGFGVESGLGILGILPFWGLALWMFFRSSKMQRALTTRGDHPRQVRARERRAAGRTSGAGGGRTATAAGRAGRRPAASAGSTPSKRYTPPKPKDAKEPNRYKQAEASRARRPRRAASRSGDGPPSR